MSSNTCKFGDNCRNIFKDCTFNHPSQIICRFDGNCTRTDCRYNHHVLLCRNLSKCSFVNCTYRHPQRDSNASVATGMGYERPAADTKYCGRPQQRIIQPTLGEPTLGEPTLGEPGPGSIASQQRHLSNTQHIASRMIQAPVAAIQRLEFTENQTMRNLTMEQKVIESHEAVKGKINHSIMQLLMRPDFNIHDESSKGTLDAFRLQLRELEDQQMCYSFVRDRIDEQLDGKEAIFQKKRELYRLQNRLPSLAKRKEIDDIINHWVNSKSLRDRFVIIQGETGSGKSTQIPQYFADNHTFRGKKIICTQPRKIAAVSLASRVSMEYAAGWKDAKVGYQVGYHVGGKKVAGKRCRIEFVTEGVLMEKVMKGTIQDFADIGSIIIDEAHERSIICDLLLGSLKKNDARWNHILIAVTSATIDLEEFSKFFHNCRTIRIPGRTFPVEIMYHQVVDTDKDIVIRVMKAALEIHKHAGHTPGDILCFLPGQEDVLRAQTILVNELKHPKWNNLANAAVFALFGRQAPDQQHEVFHKLPGNIRKIIFATDIAETSITIDGVVFVVDSGVKKEMNFDPKRNISSLKVQQISRSSAIQRAGRSGRTQPGKCYRLYSHDDYEQMQMNTPPEIFRKPLPLAILTLRSMNVKPNDFDWISCPSKEAIETAENELRMLSAIDSENDDALTELGQLISLSQQEPKVVRMLQRGMELGLGHAACTIAGILSVSNMFFWGGSDAESKALAIRTREILSQEYKAYGDVAVMFNLYQQFKIIKNGLEPVAGNHRADTIQEGNVDEIHVSVFNDNEDEMIFLGNQSQFVFPENTDIIYDNVTGMVDHLEIDGSDLSEILSLSETSEASTEQDFHELDTEYSNQLRKAGKKHATQWCRNNFINGKAMGLIETVCTELFSILRKTPQWLARDQCRIPTGNCGNEEIQKLVLSGYFLNIARKILTKNLRTTNYFSIEAQVSGVLDFKGALSNVETAPDWVIFDKILRLSTTIFPVTTPIRIEWLEKECASFYNYSYSKVQTLPTECVTRTISHLCLRTILGKNYSNLSTLEEELQCSLNVDGKLGTISGICSIRTKAETEMKLGKKIDDTIASFENEYSEVEYLSGTRVVLGKGYEIQEVLFRNEFITLYLRNISLSITTENLWRFLSGKIQKRSIRSVEMTRYETNQQAVVKMFTKNDASYLFGELQGEMLDGRNIEVAANLGSNKKIQQKESIRLKLSWPIAKSLGKCSIVFLSAKGANSLVRNFQSIFAGSRISLHGNNTRNGGKNIEVKQQSKPLPNLVNVKSNALCKYEFDSVQPNASRLQYKITVTGIKTGLDEQEIQSCLANHGITSKSVYVHRERPDQVDSDNKRSKGTLDAEPYSLLNEVQNILKPIEGLFNKDTVRTDFFDNKVQRAGMFIYFNEVEAAKLAFRRAVAVYQSMGKFGQPYRLEMDCTKSISVHKDLYSFLQQDILEIQLLVTELGVAVNTTVPTTEKSKFVVLKLRHSKTSLLEQCHGLLKDVLTCEKFSSPQMELLFTWTGKQKMEELSKTIFIHWDTKTNDIWIYGRDSIARTNAAHHLKLIIKSIQDLKTLAVFEQCIILDKRKVNLCQKRSTITQQVIIACHKSNVASYYFVGVNKIFVTGTQDSFDLLKDKISALQLLFLSNADMTNTSHLANCGLCWNREEGNFMTTSVCNHLFCYDCIKPMFEQSGPPSLPVRCPACNVPFTIADIYKVAKSATLETYLDAAVTQYQKKYSDVVKLCYKPGCRQLLEFKNAQQGRNGGRFLFCEECLTTHCVDCSEKLNKPIESHERFSCEEIQTVGLTQVLKHVQEIQNNVLNLKCPRCLRLFDRFTGCVAVTCDPPCGAAFCGLCFKDCGNDAHPHARTCPLNPTKNFFVGSAEIEKIYRNKRRNDVRNYVSDIHDVKIRNRVLQLVETDLRDHGIEQI